MARLTADQASAVWARESNVLVSAGAGSGKTTVLSERVLSLLNEGIDIDRLVVLTFTNAAAAEMKARIRKNIRDAGMFEQEKRLDNAIISTFDSFAQRIVREHRHLLSTASVGTIADPVLVKLEQEQLLQRILEETYEQGDPGFLEEAMLLFDKGDQTLVQGIRVLFSGLERLPDRIEALDRLEADHASLQRTDAIKEAFVDSLSLRAAKLSDAAADLFQLALVLPKIERYADSVRHVIQLATTASTFEDHVQAADFTVARAPSFSADDPDKMAFQDASQPFKTAWEDYRKRIKKIACKNEIELTESITEQHRRTTWIYQMTRRFLTAWEIRKKEKNLLSFRDVFDDALWLLRYGEGVATRYRESIEEILIDEYQDNNDLQETFLDALGCKRRFFVGDVKQSIYGFRDANPANFMAKADRYANHQGGRLISLTANFRSRPEVLHDINRMFERMMDVSVGGADYRNGHALTFGNLAYTAEENRTNADFGLSFLGYLPMDGEISRLAEADLMARHIAHRIRFASTHDWKRGNIRPLTYRDIAIIVDRKSAFPTYRERLTQSGIPVRVLSDETFVAAAEIQTAANLLRLVRLYGMNTFPEDEFRRAFYGVCRSYVVSIEDRQVLELFSRQAFRDADDLLMLKDDATFGELDRAMRDLSSLSTQVSLQRLYEETAHRFDLLGSTFRLEDPAAAEAKLLYLHAKLASLEGFDLDQAIAYFEVVESSGDLDIDYQTAQDDETDAVTILSMHKSKGLEFPVCYFPGLDRRFHVPEAKEFFQFDPTLGLFSKAHRRGFHDTPMHALIQDKRQAADRSERMRLLYVALTRVKECGYLLLNRTLLDKVEQKPVLRDVSERRSAQRFSDWTTHFAMTILPILELPTDALEDSNPSRNLPISAMPFAFREIDVIERPVAQKTYSTKTKLSTTAKDHSMAYGELLHERLSAIDLHQVDWKALNEVEREIVQRLVASPVLGLPEAQHFREVPLLDEFDRLAIVDLIVETADELRVVDYKTKDLDHSEYLTQVENYCALLRTRTAKRVSGYLISLMTGEVRPVEDNHETIVSES
jgi:ATP-dependent helicase/nuclease subunit A